MAIDYRQVFARLPSPYMILDADLNFVAVNEEYERATMRAEADYVGRNVFDMFPNEGESGRRLRESFQRVLESGKPDAIAYLPYDIPDPAADGRFVRRFWTCHHAPILGDQGEVTHIVQNTVDVTEVVRMAEASSLPAIPYGAFVDGGTRLLERAREAEQHQRELLQESEDFRRLFKEAPGFFAVLSGPEHVFTFTNDAYERLIGGRSVVGMPIRAALPDIAGQGFYEMLDEVYSTGRPVSAQSARVVLQHAADAAPQEAFLDFSYDAIRNRSGEVTGVFVQGMDRTEAVRTQQRQKLLLDELNHRVKNTLATVQSIASQTLRSAADPMEARMRFDARLRALSNAHNLLSEQEWASASLDTILRQEFGAYDAARFVVEGDAVTLTPKASIAMALVFHELATNAAKYGALASATGTVGVRWSQRGGELVIDWEERGGFTTSEPKKAGFGTRLIERVVTGELGGAIERRYGVEGFSCRIEVPLAAAGDVIV